MNNLVGHGTTYSPCLPVGTEQRLETLFRKQKLVIPSTIVIQKRYSIMIGVSYVFTGDSPTLS